MSSTKPARGMRDFLPADVRRRTHVIDVVRAVYEGYGFEPLETPAVENLETLMGKYGEEGNQLIFKILKRGEQLEEALKTGPGTPDLAPTDEHGCPVDELPEAPSRRDVDLSIEALGLVQSPACDGAPIPDVSAPIKTGYQLTAHLVGLASGEPVPHEHDALRWLAAEDLDDVPWLPADRPFLPELRAVLAEGFTMAGGNVGGTVRVGRTVRRQTGHWTPAVHALLDVLF